MVVPSDKARRCLLKRYKQGHNTSISLRWWILMKCCLGEHLVPRAFYRLGAFRLWQHCYYFKLSFFKGEKYNFIWLFYDILYFIFSNDLILIAKIYILDLYIII